jgi:hypothetical protein
VFKISSTPKTGGIRRYSSANQPSKAFSGNEAVPLDQLLPLHVCEGLADEGKNHAELILVDLEFFSSNWSSIWLSWER